MSCLEPVHTRHLMQIGHRSTRERIATPCARDFDFNAEACMSQRDSGNALAGTENLMYMYTLIHLVYFKRLRPLAGSAGRSSRRVDLFFNAFTGCRQCCCKRGRYQVTWLRFLSTRAATPRRRPASRERPSWSDVRLAT